MAYCNARAQLLFCSLKLLFGDVLVAVAVVFCVRSLITIKGRLVSWFGACASYDVAHPIPLFTNQSDAGR